MKTAILSTSRKKNEQRRPLHVSRLASIAPEVRKQLFFEKGYGEPFGVSDEEIAALSGGVAERDQLLSECDLVILAKPVAEDAEAMKPGATLWGWVHCVQGQQVTQAAIDRKLTYITWETMNHWDEQGAFKSHIFYANNQIAGYAGVLHALALRGMDGLYGVKKRIVLINTGQVSTGALKGLRCLGYDEIAVVTPQAPAEVSPEFAGVELYRLDATNPKALKVKGGGGERLLIDLLAEADVIVNGIFQNPLRPLMFVQPGEERCLKRNALVVDISCDTGMGFPFSRATTFDEPILKLGHFFYYAVDHTPSFLWESATWQISEALLPYLEKAVRGPEGWDTDPVLSHAIEIRDGVILNKEILVFQGRATEYPHSLSR